MSAATVVLCVVFACICSTATGLSWQKSVARSTVAGVLGVVLPFMHTDSSQLMPQVVSPANAIAQQFKLPPIDFKDKNRCVLSSSNMGQANAGRDKLFDVRLCDLKGQSGANKDMSGIIASETDFSGVNFKEGQLSKGLLSKSKFVNCDFTNAILDRAVLDDSDMTGSIFANAVLSGTTFKNANLKDTDFTDAYLGPFDLRNLCENPSLSGTNPVTGVDSVESAGCKRDDARMKFKES